MYYIMFSEYDSYKDADGGLHSPAPQLHVWSTDKTAAIKYYKDFIDFAFSINTPLAGHTYFMVFDSETTFLIENGLSKMTDSQLRQKLEKYIGLFKRNSSIAACTHILKHSQLKFVEPKRIKKCKSCGAETRLYKTAFGDWLCADCWTNYLRPTNSWEPCRGFVEYYIGIANGEYSVESFTLQERVYISRSWEQYKYQTSLTNISRSAVQDAVRTTNFYKDFGEAGEALPEWYSKD